MLELQVALQSFMGRRVEKKELLARQQTEAASLLRRVKLNYFRLSTAAKCLITISFGIVIVQDYCLACDSERIT